MAAIEGAPAPSADSRGPGRGRGRGPGRWARSAPLAPEYRDAGLFPVDEGAEANALVSPREAHVPAFEAVSATEAQSDLAVVAAEPEAPAAEAMSSPVAAESAAAPEVRAVAEPAQEPAPASRQPTEVVITEAEPGLPKKGGWWQRARATLGGGG
jgi:ribonuclease E